MKFEEALVELRKGKEIRLSIWIDKYKRVNKNGIYQSNDSLSMYELMSNDWEIYEEPGKTFLEVFEAFKEGKKIRRKEWPFKAFIHICNIQDYAEFRDIFCNDWEVIE